MVRLIDADKMLKRIESWNTSDAMDKALYNFTLNRIVEQATVDAVPVIRCKECIHFKYDADCFGDCMLDGGIVRTIYSNDFCSWAVRSEDETS